MKHLTHSRHPNFVVAVLLLLVTATTASAQQMAPLGTVVADSNGVVSISVEIGDVFLNGQEKVGAGWTSQTFSLVPGDSESGLLVQSSGTGLAVQSSGTGESLEFGQVNYGQLTVLNPSALDTVASGAAYSSEAYYLDVHSSGSGMHASLSVWANGVLHLDVAVGTLSDASQP